MTNCKYPKSWVSAALGDLNTYKPANVQPKNHPDETFELYSVPIFPEGHPEFQNGSEIGSSKQAVNPNDVLVCKINPRINRVWRTGVKNKYRQIASSEWIVVRQALLNSQYLLRYFQSHDFRSKLCADVTGVGGSLTRAQPKKVATFPIPVPPVFEQKVIADKLDTLLVQVENTKARIERIPQILKRFRQSMLAAAVTGKLTEKWRCSKSIAFYQSPVTIGSETDEAPEGWSWQRLVEIARLESGHTPRKSVTEYWKDGDIPWISLQDIRAAHGRVINHTKYMPTIKGIENSSARLLPAGTVCFSRDISVGFTTIMGKEMSTTQHFANWICDDQLNNKYLMYALMAAKDHLTISGQGTTVKTIYMPALKDFRLLTPPLEEQTKIVHQVEQIFAYADTIEKQVNDALARVEHLSKSILAKAFRGELTEQWRKDNPELTRDDNSADVLLEKIKAERESLKEQPKAKRTTAKKKINSSMRKQTIRVTEALKQAGKPLSGQQLLVATGYPIDSSTEELENFFLDVREALTREKSIVNLERSDDGQDWFALAEITTNA